MVTRWPYGICVLILYTHSWLSQSLTPHTHSGAGLYIVHFFLSSFFHTMLQSRGILYPISTYSLFFPSSSREKMTRHVWRPSRSRNTKSYIAAAATAQNLLSRRPCLPLVLRAHTRVWVHQIYITYNEAQHNNPRAPATYCNRSCSI